MVARVPFPVLTCGGNAITPPPGDHNRPIGINLTKSLSTSVGARVVEWGREGLYGRPRPVPCAHLGGNAITLPPGDHQGPLHIHPTALAPTDHLASCLSSRLSLMPMWATLEVPCIRWSPQVYSSTASVYFT